MSFSIACAIMPTKASLSPARIWRTFPIAHTRTPTVCHHAHAYTCMHKQTRLVKAAMTEGLADEWNRATDKHVTLYTRWAEGGSGALITGNFQIDRRYVIWRIIIRAAGICVACTCVCVCVCVCTFVCVCVCVRARMCVYASYADILFASLVLKTENA